MTAIRMLVIALCCSIMPAVHAQDTVIKKPTVLKLPPDLERFRDLVEKLVVSSDLVPYEWGSCGFAIIRNEGIMHAPKSITNVGICRMICKDTQWGRLCFPDCKQPVALATPEILSGGAAILRLSVPTEPGAYSLTITANATGNVSEVNKTNNEMKVGCTR